MKYYLLLTQNGQHRILDDEYDFFADAQEAGNECVDDGVADSFSVLTKEFKEHIEGKLTIQ